MHINLSRFEEELGGVLRDGAFFNKCISFSLKGSSLFLFIFEAVVVDGVTTRHGRGWL
jgi:hypothetical protein